MSSYTGAVCSGIYNNLRFTTGPCNHTAGNFVRAVTTFLVFAGIAVAQGVYVGSSSYDAAPAVKGLPPSYSDTPRGWLEHPGFRSSWNRPPLGALATDAFGNSFEARDWRDEVIPQNPVQPQGFASGSVSLAELQNPLRGDARDSIQRGQKLLNQDRIEEGLAVLQQALEDAAARPWAVSMLGVTYLKAGAIHSAILFLEQAVDLVPGRVANQSNLAYALGLTGEYGRATQHALKALQLDPSRAKTRYVLGWLLMKQGEQEEGAYHLRLAAEQLDSAKALLAELNRR